METIGNATYSAADNKIRIYPDERLEPEVYKRVKEAGFKWAPKQGLFVAPMWTPGREDLALELCGEIDDEESTPEERAEERAERFSQYSSNRTKDAEHARDNVKAIADHIPFGQPILIGHHSEKRARRDQKKIEQGMSRAVRMWDQAEYWKRRAAASLAHAERKERPDVRARRIKKIEADKRKQERYKADAEKWLALWNKEGLDQKRAEGIANFCHVYATFPLDKYPRPEGASTYEGSMSLWSALSDRIITPEQARGLAVPCHERTIRSAARWIAHYENRLTYERAMLEESGGTAADQKKPQKGGAIKCLWAPRGGWAYVQKVNRVTVTVCHTWSAGGRVFSVNVPFDKIAAVMTPEEVKEAREARRLVEIEGGKTGFLLGLDRETEKKPEPKPAPEPDEKAQEVEKMRETLKKGVEVVTAPQLFTTPAELAQRMRLEANPWPGDEILEPSAGTGAILDALPAGYKVTAVEFNQALAERLKQREGLRVVCEDFLSCNGNLGKFDRVLMNPPFKNADDIKHIKHALEFLKPGGRIVAICANGPRQQEQLKPLAEDSGGFYEPLPAGTFKQSGTMVNAALLVIEA